MVGAEPYDTATELRKAVEDLDPTSECLVFADEIIDVECWDPASGATGLSLNRHQPNQDTAYVRAVIAGKPALLPVMRAAVGHASLPLGFRAHCADILLRLGDRGVVKRQLVDTLVAAWEARAWNETSRGSRWLLAAIHWLAMFDDKRLSQLSEAAFEWCEAHLNERRGSDTGGLSYPLRVLDLMASNRRVAAIGAEGIRRLLNDAEAVLGTGPFSYVDDVHEVRLTLAKTLGDFSGVAAAQRSIVEQSLVDAEVGDNLTKWTMLNKALEQAQKYRLDDLERSIRIAIETGPSPFEQGHTFMTLIRLKSWRPADGIGWYETLRSCCWWLVANTHGLRSDIQGVPADNLLSLFTKSVVGAHNTVVRTLTPDDEALRLVRQLLAGVHAQAIDELVRVGKASGVPGTANTFLEQTLLRSLQRYADGDFDEAVHILTPRIEDALRGLNQAGGAPRYVPTADGGARERTLRFLTGPYMENVMGDAELAYVKFILAEDDEGFNLRNSIAHGNGARLANQHEAALALGAAAMTVLAELRLIARAQQKRLAPRYRLPRRGRLDVPLSLALSVTAPRREVVRARPRPRRGTRRPSR